MNFFSSQAFRYSVSVIFLCLLSVVNSFAQSASEWQDISLTGADSFSIDAEYRYKISSAGNFWLYPREVSAQSLVSNESYFGQIFYVNADTKTAYQYNGNLLDTVVQIQKRTLPSWTDVSLTGGDPFDLTYEYRFKMTVPGRPGVPAGDFWYYAKQVGTESLVMDNGYGEITFVSAANKTAYLSQGTPTGITISQMQRRALTWTDVPLNNTETYDVSCSYRFKMNYPASPQWRPGVPAGDFWHYPERSSTQSLIANANGGYQTFSVFANNKTVFDFNGVSANTVTQMQKQCFVPPSTLCSEGQYFCTAENICKPAGQGCGTATCNNNTPVSWTQFNNPSPNNINSPGAVSLGSASGSIQLGGKNIQVNYAGDVRSVGIANNWSWVWTGNTAPFLSTLVPNIPDPANLLGVFGGSQAMNTLTFSEPVTNPILLFYSVGSGGVSITYEFDRPFTIVSSSTGIPGQGDFVNPSGNILRGTEGYGVIQFQGTFSTLSFKVPTAEYWSAFTVGLKEAAACPTSVTCNNNNTCEAGESCNCGDCTNGGTDDADKCGLSNGAQMVCTKDKDNTTTAGAFSSVTAQENFNTVNNQLATVLSQPGNANIAVGEFGTAATELKMTQYDWKDAAGNFISFSSFTQGEAWTKVKELLSIPASAQVLWSTSSIKYENDSLGNNERYLYSYVIQQTSGVQKQIFFATEYLPVINGWRKIYFISKDYPLSTTTTGTEVCQNFTNPTLFGKPLALGSPSVGSSGIVPFCTEQGFRGTSTVVNTSFLTGWLTLWKSNGTGWEPNQNGDKINEIRCCGIPANATGTPVQVGACCPAGAQWDSSQGKCLTACEPIVTLKQGSDLTTIKNPQGEAFSTNTTCANKNISLSPCNTTMGVVADGTSTSGNKLYKWPKTASGLSKDYNLVEINGQCWFADNLQEIPSNVPTSGVNDNLSPHNFYGYYDYVGTGINRPEGFLYQFDAATNMVAPAGAPAERQQGVCPAGWHIATDCEFQYVEHTLGMTVTEQQAVGVRTSGAVGTAMKSGGNSGFDMPLSGARRYNTGFINGGSEGHLWSTDCDASAWPAGGCYKRILNVTDGNIARIKGDGGTYDSAHHAAGSVRCVKDGSTTPVNTCPVPGCAEGEYYCHAELKCKTAGASCGTVTCNNNNVCDANESCDCADCNEKVDHCGLSGTGEQMICTKDTAEKCYTDKFPYCLSACLDGYKMDTNGQCIPVAPVGVPQSCTVRGVQGIEGSVALCNAGEVRVGGGCENTNGGAYRFFTFPLVKGETWWNYTNVAENGWACGSGSTGTYTKAYAICCSAPTTGTYEIRKGAPGIGSKAECLAGEVRTGGGCKNLGGSAFLPVSYPLAAGSTFGSFGAVTNDGWGCATGASDTTTEAYAICYNPGTGPSFTTTIRTQAGAELATAECLAGEVRTGGGCSLVSGTAYHYAIFPSIAGLFNGYGTPTNDGFVCATGSTGTYTQAYAVCASKVPNNSGTSNTGSQNFTYPIKNDGYVKDNAASVTQYCVEKGFTAGSVISSFSNGAKKSIWNGTAWTSSGDASSYSREIQCMGGTQLNFTCQNYKNPQASGSPISVGPVSTTRFCSEKGFTQPFLVSQSYTGGTLVVWNGTSWAGNLQGYKADDLNCCNLTTVPTTPSSCRNFTYPTNKTNYTYDSATGYVAGDTSGATQFCTEKGYTSGTLITAGNLGSIPNIALEVQCCGGNVTATCQNYTNPAIGGGLVIVRPASTAQFCKEKGFTEPFMKSWNMVGTVAVWSGTSWYGDTTGGGATSLECCNLTSGTVATASGTEPQLGACCPPGSAWNSVENRCIPTTCGEGQFYCAAQKKCLTGGQTCDTAVCNNDGVCSGEESCQCGDCVNGGGDDKDKCSIVGGTQAMCSDDNLTDDKPGACCVPPKKWNTATSSCVECSNTQAPSELKAGIDQPYITCTGNGDTTKTHFKYRITKQGSTDAPFISEIFTIGTPVLHPTMTLGDYTVECFYGNATGVDTSTTATPHSCVKTMSVKSDAQGCSRVYPYKESTLSDEMISASAFDASFRCGSRKPVVGAITNPYMFRVGTQAPAYLSFDALISELFNGLTIGPVSTQTQNYNFDTGNTDVTCATKVGGGYSTNTACQLRTCVGGACNVPQTFSVVHSDDLICTTEETSTYNIGCNPAAPDSVRNQCIQWFRDAVNAGSRNVSNGVEFDVSFVFNADTPTNVTCIKYVAGQMPGGLNLSDNVVCRATLKNGEKYQIYAADTNGRIDALQTTAKTVERDREAPTMAEIKYYTDETLTTEISSTQWYNKPVIALAVCSDTPLNEATSCACAQRVDTTTTDADSWSLGVPNSLIGADLMRYTRTITETLTGTQKVQVMDTAGNTSTAKNIAVSLDTQAPLVTPTESGTGATRTITLTASDTGSKIWKTTGAPSGATNTSGIIYRVGPKADMATLAFDTACNTTATYATVTETQSSSYPSQATATISNLNTATQVVAYCVRDNAGNTTRGMYPVITDACFSATNMPTIPTFDTYKSLLKTRLTATGTDNQKYGYSFSENSADASCFRGILSNNITTLMTNQLKPRISTTLSNWDLDRAELSTSTTLSNGYYYYVYPTSNTLNIVTSPTGGAPVKSVVVDGGDIRIKTDINYSGAGKTLLLIARKNSNGQGGNIIIDTNVKNIDAILIADGGALRSSDVTLPGERLTINGRLYSYNTRGGSLTVSGTDFVDSTTPKKFTNSSLVSASSLNDARIQDLERFRPIFADGNNTCSLVVNHQVFTTANLPALLKRPNTFTGGSCGF